MMSAPTLGHNKECITTRQAPIQVHIIIRTHYTDVGAYICNIRARKKIAKKNLILYVMTLIYFLSLRMTASHSYGWKHNKLTPRLCALCIDRPTPYLGCQKTDPHKNISCGDIQFNITHNTLTRLTRFDS